MSQEGGDHGTLSLLLDQKIITSLLFKEHANQIILGQVKTLLLLGKKNIFLNYDFCVSLFPHHSTTI